MRKISENVKNELNNQTTRLIIHERDKKDLQRNISELQSNPVPIGFIYVQLPNQPEPKTLWPMVEWKDVTSKYAGLFFRAEGGGSAPFGDIQIEDSPRLTKVDWTSFGVTYSLDYVGTKYITPGLWSIRFPTGFLYESSKADSIQFLVSNVEVRPRNKAMRIWKRIK